MKQHISALKVTGSPNIQSRGKRLLQERPRKFAHGGSSDQVFNNERAPSLDSYADLIQPGKGKLSFDYLSYPQWNFSSSID